MSAINRQFSTIDANCLVSCFKPPEWTQFDDQSAFQYSRTPARNASRSDAGGPTLHRSVRQKSRTRTRTRTSTTHLSNA